MTEATVNFLPHARARALERFPGMDVADMQEEVRDALRSGRLSGVRPAWLAPARDVNSIYCWNEDRSRTYGIAGGETSWHVKTVMAPNPNHPQRAAA